MSQGAWSRARGLPLATAPLVALVAFLAAMLLGAELGAREPGAPDDVTLTLDPARWFQERTPTPSVLRDPEGRWTIDDVRDPALAQPHRDLVGPPDQVGKAACRRRASPRKPD